MMKRAAILSFRSIVLMVEMMFVLPYLSIKFFEALMIENTKGGH
jgi:hypothetical protein